MPPLVDDDGRLFTNNINDIVEVSKDCDEADDIGDCYKEKQKKKG